MPQAQNLLHLASTGTKNAVPISSEGHHYQGVIEGGHWVDAADLKAGYRLLNNDESWAEVVNVRVENNPLKAYNLTVEEFHTYFVRGADNDNAAPVWVHNDCAKNFEKSLVGLSPGERVAKVRAKLSDVANVNGWTKNSKLSKVNGRDVYQDPKTKNYYAVDSQHGHFEVTNKRGKHKGSIDIDGNDVPNKIDASGGHDLVIK